MPPRAAPRPHAGRLGHAGRTRVALAAAAAAGLRLRAAVPTRPPPLRRRAAVRARAVRAVRGVDTGVPQVSKNPAAGYALSDKNISDLFLVFVRQMLPVPAAVAHAARAVRALAAPRAADGAVDARVAVPHRAAAAPHVRPAVPRHARQ